MVLTCFNRPLGDAFGDEFADNELATAGSFHHFTHMWGEEAGLEFPESPSPTWWDDPAGKLLLEAFASGVFGADAVIIDEGQDLDDSWFIALKGALDRPAEGLLLIFADSHQAIYRDEWEPPFGVVEYFLDLNCRNTTQTAELVARVYGDDLPTLGAEGPAPEFHAIESPEGADRALRGILHRLVNEGSIAADRVIVLTQRRETKDRLIGQISAGLALAPMGEPESVAVETIHRFKGLEADAAIVILNRLEKDRDHVLAYIGLSRARYQVIVIGPGPVGTSLGLA